MGREGRTEGVTKMYEAEIVVSEHIPTGGRPCLSRPDRWNESMAFVYAIDGAAILTCVMI